MLKRFEVIYAGVLVPTLWFSTTLGVLAENTVPTVEPTQLNVTGMRGSATTRQLILSSSTPIPSPQLIPLDLIRSDGAKVFPAANIRVKVVSQPKPTEATAQVSFDLRNFWEIPSGEFSGKLRLSDATERVDIPVTIRIKDFWLPPLIVVIIGTGLGIAVSTYRVQGQPKDEVLLRVGRLRSQIQEEPEASKSAPFQTQVEAYLYDVKIAIQGEQLEFGRTAVSEAEQVWRKWVKGRNDWLAQLAYREELVESIQDLNPNVLYVQTVRRELEDIYRNAPNFEGPDKLRDRLDEIAQQINRYLQLQAKMKLMNEVAANLSAEQIGGWQVTRQTWERRFNLLLPKDMEQYQQLQTEAEEAITRMTELVSQTPSAEGVSKGLSKLAVPRLIAGAPSAQPLSWQEEVSTAGQRLNQFKVASYAIAIIFLAGTGFNQLYMDNPTFGANPWKDYFALLAWGFGAEATRDAVTKMVQGWGLPGVK